MPKYRAETAKVKAQQVAKGYIESGFNKVKLAKREGISHQAVCKKLRNPLVLATLQETLNKIGIDNLYKSNKLKELLESMKLQNVRLSIREENGELKVIKNENDFIEVADNHTRLGALRLAFEVSGDIKNVTANNIYDTKIIQLIVKNDKNKPLLKRIKDKTV